MHRAVAILTRLTPQEVPHDSYMTLVWHILKAGNPQLADELHTAKGRFRCYVWGIEEWATGGTMTFSSIRPEITKAFLEGCANLSGTAVLCGPVPLLVAQAVPIKDLEYYGASMRLMAKAPISVTVRGDNGKKQHVFFTKNPDVWVRRVSENLRARAKAFLGVTPEFRLEVVDPGSHRAVRYKEGDIPGRYATVKAVGDADAIRMAIYGGLGEHTGSGFGLVVPV